MYYTLTFKEKVCAPTINSILVLASELLVLKIQDCRQAELSSLDSPHLILSCSSCLSHLTPLL